MAEVDRCIGPSSKQLVQLLKNGLLGELSRQAYEGSLDREDKFRRRIGDDPLAWGNRVSVPGVLFQPVSRRWKNTPDDWGTIAKTFHWLIAVLVLGQLVIGKVADEMALSPQKLDFFVWHKSIGVSVLLLALLRLLWRVGNAPPTPPPGIPRWETRLARIGHTLLYVLLFAVPISGWWISDSSRIPFKAFWIVPMPDWLPTDRAIQELAEDAHGMLIIALLTVLTIHIAAALRHHFLLRNDTLRRMLPWPQGD